LWRQTGARRGQFARRSILPSANPVDRRRVAGAVAPAADLQPDPAVEGQACVGFGDAVFWADDRELAPQVGESPPLLVAFMRPGNGDGARNGLREGLAVCSPR